MFNSHIPTQGSLLISEPFISDQNFERSVIMLCEHNQEGSVGLVLNHRSHLLLSDILNEKAAEKFPLYIGGPVNDSSLFFLHQASNKITGGTLITEDIYWGGDYENLLFLIETNQLSPDEIKFS